MNFTQNSNGKISKAQKYEKKKFATIPMTAIKGNQKAAIPAYCNGGGCGY